MSKQRSESTRSIELPRWLLIACHVVVVLAGVALIVGHLAWNLVLSWEIIFAAVLTILPFLLPVLCLYLGEVSASGATFKPVVAATQVVEAPEEGADPRVAGAMGATGPDAPVAPAIEIELANADPSETGLDWVHLRPDEKKVMRTLWKYQRDFFEELGDRRWGFRVHENAFDYKLFVDGVRKLKVRGLVTINAKGQVFLSNKGLHFCRSHRHDIADGGELWDTFGSE